MSSDTPNLPVDPGKPTEPETKLATKADDDVAKALPLEGLIVEGGDPHAKSLFGLKAAPLLLGAFLIVALAAAGVYLAKKQMRREEAPRAESAANTPAPAATTIELPSAATPAPHTGAAPPPEKIFNAANDALKTGAAAIGAAGPSGDGTISELPPPPEGVANHGLQEAAKDAAKRFAPKPGDPATIDLSAPEDAAAAQTPDKGANADFVSPAEGDKVAAAIDNARLAEEVAGLKRALQSDVASLTATLDAERQHTAEQAGEIARLNAELDRLRAAGSPMLAKARAAAAARALADRAASGAPYRRELAAFLALSPSTALPPLIAARADKGLPTPASLAAQFPALRNKALASARREGAAGPVEKLGASLASLVNLRPASAREGPGPVAALSRAEARIDKGDLAAALAELSSLPGGAGAAFAPFIVDARLMLDARAAFDAADRAILGSPGAERAY